MGAAFDKNDSIADVRRRDALIGLTASILTLPSRVSGEPSPPTILFVCQYGTGKSAIARELLRRRARERGIAVSAISRGITPAEHVSPALRDRLVAEGIDSRRDGLNKLQSRDLGAANIIVAFDPLPAPMVRPGVVDWSAVPSVNDSYPLARADLDRRIDLLLDQVVRDDPRHR